MNPPSVSRIGLAAPASLDDVPAQPWEPPTPLVDVERPPTFPLDCLPEPARTFVQMTADSLGHNDPALVAIALLPAVSTLTAGRFVVSERPGFFEPLQLFTCGIGLPSTGKSPALDAMVRPVLELDSELQDAHRVDAAGAESRRRIDDQKRKNLEGKAAQGKASADELRELDDLVRFLADPLPAAPRLVTTDGTPEGLTRVMAEQGGRIAQLDDEPGVLGMMAGRYQSRGAPPNLDPWLKGWAGSFLIVDRAGNKEPLRVERPALTLGIMAQPATIRDAGKEKATEGRGVMARFLYAWPALEAVDFSRVAPPVPEHLARAYATRLRELHTVAAGIDPNAPRVLTVDPDATDVMRAWFGQVKRLEDATPAGHLAEWIGKIGKTTQRLAGNLALLADPHATSVSLEHATAAVRLARDYFTPHARRVFGELAQNDRHRRAVLCLEAIRNGATRGEWERWPHQVKPAEVRAVVRSHRTLELDDAAMVRDAIAMLVDRDYLRPAAVTEPQKPGRPVEWFDVNPAAFDVTPAGEPAPVDELEPEPPRIVGPF